MAQVGGGGIDGVFSRFSGTFDLHPDDIARSSVKFPLQPESVTTGQPRVKDFLRSSAVFDVAAYPVIAFRSTAIRQQGSDKAVIEGLLTARGITRRETFEATLIRRQGRTVAFHVVGDMMRSPYGMDVGTPASTGSKRSSGGMKRSVALLLATCRASGCRKSPRRRTSNWAELP